MANSDKHREGQDYFMGFAKEKLRYKEGGVAKIMAVYTEFKNWYLVNHGKNIPQGKELNEFMDKRYGMRVKNVGWRNVEVIFENEDEDEIETL